MSEEDERIVETENGTYRLPFKYYFSGGPVSFEVKDSGERAKFPSGMQRDTNSGKTLYDLVFDGPMLIRWAEHLTKGARKYEPKNWMKAYTEEELLRFRESAIRHFFQWLKGETDEDHAAAVFFNINGVEFVKQQAPKTVHDGSQPGRDFPL